MWPAPGPCERQPLQRPWYADRVGSCDTPRSWHVSRNLRLACTREIACRVCPRLRFRDLAHLQPSGDTVTVSVTKSKDGPTGRRVMLTPVSVQVGQRHSLGLRFERVEAADDDALPEAVHLAPRARTELESLGQQLNGQSVSASVSWSEWWRATGLARRTFNDGINALRHAGFAARDGDAPQWQSL